MRAVTNTSGTVQNTYEYDAYGKVITTTGTAYNPFGYTGEYTDNESGLIYLRARYYDPGTQQFLTVDPMLASTEQAYAYAGGSPTNLTDPSGNCPWCLLLLVFAGGYTANVGTGVAIDYALSPDKASFNWGSELADEATSPTSFLVVGGPGLKVGGKVGGAFLSSADNVAGGLVDNVAAGACKPGMPQSIIGHWKPGKADGGVFGPQNYTQYYVNDPAFRVLNLPGDEWTWGKNVGFLPQGLDNGGLLVVTPYTRLGSTFAKEQKWLYDNGATFEDWLFTWGSGQGR